MQGTSRVIWQYTILFFFGKKEGKRNCHGSIIIFPMISTNILSCTLSGAF